MFLSSIHVQVLSEFSYEVVYGCGHGSVHQTCLVLLVAATATSTTSVGAKVKPKKEYLAHVLEAPSMELAQTICAHIGMVAH